MGQDSDNEGSVINKTILVLLAIVMLIPLYFLATKSLTDMAGVMIMPPTILPARPSLDNYAFFLKYIKASWIYNTVIIAVGTALTSVTVATAAGYAFAFFKFRSRRSYGCCCFRAS